MLKLRPYRASDADVIVKWVKDEVSFRKWVADRYESFPIRPEDINAHYNAAGDINRFIPMTAVDEFGVVGHLILRFTDEDREILRLGFIIVDDEKRGKGYGKEMIRLAMTYGFEILKARTITLGVFENNDAALQCYKAAGFKIVPKENIEKYKIFGEEWNCIEMEADRKQRLSSDHSV